MIVVYNIYSVHVSHASIVDLDALKYTFYTTEWLGSNQFYDLSVHLVSVYCGKNSEMKVSWP